MRGQYSMTKPLTRKTLDVFLQSGLYTALIMVVSLAVLGIYQGQSNLGWWVLGLLTPAIVIWLRILLWQDGENKLPKKSAQPGSAVHLWADADASSEIQCLHCGKPIIIQCRAGLLTFSIRPQYKSPKRSRTRR